MNNISEKDIPACHERIEPKFKNEIMCCNSECDRKFSCGFYRTLLKLACIPPMEEITGEVKENGV